jgi:hypothetical protein
MWHPFRPRRKVTDPTGQEWELYVCRVELPEWKESYDSWGEDPMPFTGPAALLELPLMLISFLWSSLLVPLLRLVFLTPFAVVKGRRSQAAQIQAICFFPYRETRTWTTTLDQVDSVLNQIALGIEVGKVVQPIGAVYSGSHTD